MNMGSRTYWDDLMVLCIGHVTNSIDIFRSRDRSAADWAAPRLLQLVEPAAVQLLVHRARSTLSDLTPDSPPREFEAGQPGSWITTGVVLPSAADADFLSRCPKGSVEEYLVNWRQTFLSSSSNWPELNCAHWMLLLNPQGIEASVHLYTHWSMLFLGMWIEQSHRNSSGPPVILPIELLSQPAPDFVRRMMLLDAEAAGTAVPD